MPRYKTPGFYVPTVSSRTSLPIAPQILYGAIWHPYVYEVFRKIVTLQRKTSMYAKEIIRVGRKVSPVSEKSVQEAGKMEDLLWTVHQRGG